MASLLSAMQSLVPQTAEEAEEQFLQDATRDPIVDFESDRSNIDKRESKEDRDARELHEFAESKTPDDIILDDLFDAIDDEDEELRANLVNLGRKYSAGSPSAKDESDIETRFAPQLNELNKLSTSVENASRAVDNDLSQIRMARSRNSKALADLVSARSSLFSTSLSIIKEKSNIQKTILDMQIKMKDKNAAVEANAAATQAAVQEVLNSGLISYDADFDSPDSENEGSGENKVRSGDTMSDEERVKSIFGDESRPGDDYIKHEYDGVQLHVRMNRDGSDKQIVAIDKNGEEVPDYPVPDGDPEELGIQANDDIGIATDGYNREYILDYNDY